LCVAGGLDFVVDVVVVLVVLVVVGVVVVGVPPPDETPAPPVDPLAANDSALAAGAGVGEGPFR
jgi:hypothetical protein